MQDKSPDIPTRTVATQSLSTSQRVSAGLTGFAMIALAGYAVVKGHDGATSVSFVVAGCVSMVLALLGYLPLRIKYKDTEVDLRREIVENVVDPIASDMNETELQQSAEELTSNAASGSSGTAAAAASRFYEHIGFERTVLNGLQELSRRRNWRVEISKAPSRRFDAEITFIEQVRPLYIEARLSLRTADLRKLAGRLKGVEADVVIFVQDDADVAALQKDPMAANLHGMLGTRKIMIIAWNLDSAMSAIDYIATGNSEARERLDLLTDYLIITGYRPNQL